MELEFDLLESLNLEVDHLRKILAIYSNVDNWHNNYSIESSFSGEGLKLVWARQENGWEQAKKALGDY